MYSLFRSCNANKRVLRKYFILQFWWIEQLLRSLVLPARIFDSWRSKDLRTLVSNTKCRHHSQVFGSDMTCKQTGQLCCSRDIHLARSEWIFFTIRWSTRYHYTPTQELSSSWHDTTHYASTYIPETTYRMNCGEIISNCSCATYARCTVYVHLIYSSKIINIYLVVSCHTGQSIEKLTQNASWSYHSKPLNNVECSFQGKNRFSDEVWLWID